MRSATRKALTAGVTFSVALSIGFVMQYGDALAARIGGDDPVGGPDTRPATLPDIRIAAVTPERQLRLPLDMAAVTPVPKEAAVPRMMMPADDAAEQAVQAPAQINQITADGIMSEPPALAMPAVAQCATTLLAEPVELAMVALTLSNDCHPNGPVTIHHQGMMFSEITDGAGNLQVTVPALSRDALFIVDLKTAKGAAVSVIVPEVEDIDRAVLQWQGSDGVQLHALEFGAGYDDAGHIWAASKGDAELARAGQGGVLTSLGNTAASDPLLAEVYTYPSGQSGKSGTVMLNVEAEITNSNCGRSVAAQSIQLGPDRQTKAVDLTMTMPSCDTIGEFLVLNNMFADLTLAAK